MMTTNPNRRLRSTVMLGMAIITVFAAIIALQTQQIYKLTKEKYDLIQNQAILQAKVSVQSVKIEELTRGTAASADELASARQELEQLIDTPHPPPLTDTTGWTSFKATYYNEGWQSTGKSSSDTNYGITRSGHRVTAGLTAAVDPRVIPLGTWFVVKFPDGTMETYRADDTGSAVHGNKIDIYIPFNNQVAMSNGVSDVKIKILR